MIRQFRKFRPNRLIMSIVLMIILSVCLIRSAKNLSFFYFYFPFSPSPLLSSSSYLPMSPILPISMYRINAELDIEKPSLLMNKTIQEVIDNQEGFMTYSSTFLKSNLIVFESYNNIDAFLIKMANRWPKTLRYVMGVQGTDLLVSKSALAGYLQGEEIIPDTYILSEEDELKRLGTEYDPRAYYILKKNIQRQQGFVVTNKYEEIFDQVMNKENKFVVCQKMLQNPFLVENRKINLRAYLLLVIDGPRVNWYVYNNGFIYYTPAPFRKNSSKQEHIITSGYVERKLYDDLPMTFGELKDKIGKFKFGKIRANILDAFRIVKDKYTDTFIEKNASIPGIKFSLFGCDVAPDENMNISLLEINKGPDIGYKDKRDRAVKYNLITSMFKVIGIIPNEIVDAGNSIEDNNKFVKL